MGSDSSKPSSKSQSSSGNVADYGYKVVFLGGMDVGKTSVIYRIYDNTFQEYRYFTTGFAYVFTPSLFFFIVFV